MSRTNGVVFLVAELRDRAYEHVTRELGRLGMNELSPSHGAILITLYREKTLSLKDLALHIKRKSPPPLSWSKS